MNKTSERVALIVKWAFLILVLAVTYVPLLMIIVFIVVGLMNLILNHLGRSSSDKIDFFKQ